MRIYSTHQSEAQVVDRKFIKNSILRGKHSAKLRKTRPADFIRLKLVNIKAFSWYMSINFIYENRSFRKDIFYYN